MMRTMAEKLWRNATNGSAAMYDNQWHIGIIKEVDRENKKKSFHF